MDSNSRQDVRPAETVRSGEGAVRVNAAMLASSVARRSRSPFPRGPRPLSIVVAIGFVAMVSVAAFWFWHKRAAERNMIELPQFAMPENEIADKVADGAVDKVADEARALATSKDEMSEPTSQPTEESAKATSSAPTVVEPAPTKPAPEQPPEPPKNVIRIPLRPLSDLTDPD